MKIKKDNWSDLCYNYTVNATKRVPEQQYLLCIISVLQIFGDFVLDRYHIRHTNHCNFHIQQIAEKGIEDLSVTMLCYKL